MIHPDWVWLFSAGCLALGAFLILISLWAGRR